MRRGTPTLGRATRLRAVVAGTLAAWLGLVSLAHTIVHAHAGGLRPHAHNSSWAVSQQDGPAVPHRHLVLFDFDLGHSELDTPLPTDGVPPGVPAAVDADPGPDPAPVPPAPPPAGAPAVLPPRADLPPGVVLSPFSRHAVSGVRLA